MFTYNTKVSYSRVNKNGQVPLYEIMNYFQDCTNFHSESIGAGVAYMESIRKGWVLIAYKIKINKPIVLGQDICVGTAPTEFGGLYASRNFFIKDSDGEYLVKADSTWVLIDLDSRRLVRIAEEDCVMYNKDKEQGFEDIKASRKLKLAGEKCRFPECKVMRTYIDNNGHMNNADYLRVAEEILPVNYSCSELDIVYNKEALEGETIIPYLYNEEDSIGIRFENQQGELLATIKIYN